MNRFSNFSDKMTDVIYQDIEELQEYLSSDAQFFIEEKEPDEDKSHLVKILFQIQDGKHSWQVEVHANNIEDASYYAKEWLVKKFEKKVLDDYAKTGQIFN